MSRIEKVNEQLRREISIIIQRELADPRLGFVSITNVIVSRDLQHAKIYFTVLGDQTQLSNTECALDAAKGFIRKLVGDRVRMRFTPELIFIHDQSLELRQNIEDTLREINNESKECPTDHP